MDTAILQEADAQSAQQTTREVSESGKGLARRIKGPAKWFLIWAIASICFLPIYIAWWIAGNVLDYSVAPPISEYISASSSAVAGIASLAFLAMLYNSFFFVMTPVLLSKFGISFSKGWILRFIPAHLLSFTVLVLAFDFLFQVFYARDEYAEEGVFNLMLALKLVVLFLTLIIALFATLKISVRRACQVSIACITMHLSSFLTFPILKLIVSIT